MASRPLSRITNLQRHFNPSSSTPKGEMKVKVSQEVSEALSLGKAVVALESAIISHEMPYPQNLETAKEVEAIVRQNGAIPATIAILGGIPCIGLSVEELEKLAILGTNARKTACRDIAHVVATRENGATTVSATMVFASMVGISIFVTGGIGGVHRHGESTMDISSDLTELGRTPVAVVSAGIKSVLDISRTLEYLETEGVFVTAYQTNEFPAFFTEKSGYKAPCRVDSPEDCARVIDSNNSLKLKTGILIAVPIPSEHSASGNMIESAIQRALKEAREQNISGSAETPFLLTRVNELTGGASLSSNIALVKNNARVGAQIAVCLSQLQEQSCKGDLQLERRKMTSRPLYRINNLQKHFNPSSPTPKGEMKVKVSQEVSEALSLGKAVVALESTIISHGMPYPQNLETAKEVEAIVRQNGAIPATIAILGGIPCIGLCTEELEKLAILGTNARKTARRDIAQVVATRENGATTVSATMVFASMVGISIFVTGGIGGVHRHGESTMDISSDLTELGRTPVAVVSAGIKSILDISRTLENLETKGVFVAAYQTNEFPAFFTEKSGYKAPCRVDSPEDCARVIDSNNSLKLRTGSLIAVPIPSEHSASGNIIESAIQRALKEAREQNISGSAETPFLLTRVNELTGGASLSSNIALVKNNARVGAQIAVCLSQLREQSCKGT